MADTEDLDILIRLRGGRVAASEAKAVDQAIGGIGKSAKTTGAATEDLGKKTEKTSNVLSGTLGIAIRYAAAYWGIHRAIQAFGSGFAFDSAMEQNRVAFTHFLGSAKAADAYLRDLYQIAATTPFQFADVTMGAKRLIAMGADANEAKKELITLADAASGLGIGNEGINRLVLAIGQIRAAGRIQGDEIRQLQEAGINAYKYLIDAGLLTQKQVGKIGNMNIDSTKAIAAIMAGMQADFGGMSEAQARTWQGQLSTIKDYAAQAAGALVKPIFDLGRSSVLPSIAAHLQQWSKWLNAGGAQDIYSTLGKILKILGPLTAAWLSYRAALLLVAAAEWAVATGSAAMALAGTLGTVLTLVPAVTSLADVMYLASVAAGALGLSLSAVATLGLSVLIAALVAAYFKVTWFHNAVNAVFEFVKNHWALIGVLFTGPIGAMVIPIIKHFETIKNAFRSMLNWIIGKWNWIADHLKAPSWVPGIGEQLLPHIPMLANGGDVRSGGMAVVGERGPEMLENRGGVARVTPMSGGGGGRTLQPLIVQIEGRTFAKLMVDLAQTEAARG